MKHKYKPFGTIVITAVITFSLFTVLCSLLTVSCDLFQPNNPNYYQELLDEVAWANAAKLTVHLSYDPEWGTSNPAMGQITPARDIRQGYAFDLEF
ncbi:MAG: hypothetical protein FWG89_11420, partial [Treponema sp.]|nr:hypothetical protein [Treponema sp.]